MKYIKIDGYEAKVEGEQIRYYAIKGKDRIEMPSYYRNMYDNKHLAIVKRTMDFPELYELTEKEHYIPLSTEVYRCQKREKKNQ